MSTEDYRKFLLFLLERANAASNTASDTNLHLAERSRYLGQAEAFTLMLKFLPHIKEDEVFVRYQIQ